MYILGHATLIGNESGKCLDYGVKSIDCRKCLFTANSSDHDCRKNYAGSARSMESAIAVDLVSHMMELGYRIQSITMDDDTTTISRLKSTVDPNIEKLCDKNHIKKNLSNSLYNVKKDYKQLSSTVISYLVKCTSYAISQNHGDAESLKKNLAVIVPHAFGEHEHCSESWCGYKKTPDTYKHSGLPGGCDLTNTLLKRDLETVFNKLVEKSDKLVHCGSSQANESLNYIISTKAPKSKHFGGSESLNFRVAAGVAQKNAGRQYVVGVSTCIMKCCSFRYGNCNTRDILVLPFKIIIITIIVIIIIIIIIIINSDNNNNKSCAMLPGLAGNNMISIAKN